VEPRSTQGIARVAILGLAYFLLFGTLVLICCWAAGSVTGFPAEHDIIGYFANFLFVPLYAVCPLVPAISWHFPRSTAQGVTSAIVCSLAGAAGIIAFGFTLPFSDGEGAQIPSIYLTAYIVLAVPVIWIGHGALLALTRRSLQ